MRWRRELSWNPGDLGWRIALLFMVGSFLFALGSFPPYSQLVDGRAVGITFVVGSLFFTAGGYSALLEVINSPDDLRGDPAPAKFRFWARQPAKTAWWAAFIQLVGTLLFNANTIGAMIETFTIEQTNRLVWGPDFLGSIAFLVASHLFWLGVCHRLWCVRSDDPDWWGALVNYVGSVFFMASAIASFTLKTTGEAINITIVNLGTFIGAVCFLVGGYVSLPPAHRVQTAVTSPTSQS
ncbi:MAG: hypothetical protein OEU32_02470 [Acidimicrobiia bacterium]|nr:hypothetical protein [Acidimicrobiia bacterium]